MKREKGYYWVSLADDKTELTVAEYDGLTWQVIGHEECLPSSVFSYISPTPISEPKLNKSLMPEVDYRIPGAGC